MFFHLQRSRIELIAFATGNFSGQLHRLFERQFIGQNFQHAPGGCRIRCIRHRRAFHQQHEFAFNAVGVVRKPRRRVAQRAGVDGLEEFREP